MKKVMSLMLVLAMLCGLLAGCGGSSTAETTAAPAADGNNAAAETAAPAEAGDQTLTIFTWTNQGSVDAFEELSAKFTEETGIKVDVVASSDYNSEFNSRIQANTCDIFCYNWDNNFGGMKVDWAVSDTPDWQVFIDGGNALDLTDYDWIKNWSIGADVCTYNDRVWGICTGAAGITGVFYNKQMFADNGWEVPETWDEFVALCEAIQATGVAPMTCGGGGTWPYAMIMSDMIASVDADVEGWVKGLWTGERTFTDEKSMEVFRRIDTFNSFMEPGFMGISYAEVPGRFVTGKAAMLPDGSWQAASIRAADPDFEFGYFVLPGTEPGLKLQGKYDLTLGINANSKNIDAAVKWMEMFSQPENYKIYAEKTGFIPTMDIETDDAFLAEVGALADGMTKSMNVIMRLPPNVGQYCVTTAYNGNYLKSAGGPVATPEELAELAQADWDAAMAAIGK